MSQELMFRMFEMHPCVFAAMFIVCVLALAGLIALFIVKF